MFSAQVGADHVGQPVLGHTAVSRVVGQQQRHAAQAEDAVGDEHGALVALVQVPQDVLRSRNDDAHVAVILQTKHRMSVSPTKFVLHSMHVLHVMASRSMCMQTDMQRPLIASACLAAREWQ